MPNTKRLMKLADFLETVPRKKFDIGMWVTSRATEPEGDKPGECGFGACAMGWAVHAELFEGLSFALCDWPKYEGRIGLDAAQTLFDIHMDTAKHFFIADEYPGRRATPKQVAKRIRAFVANPSLALERGE